MRTLSPPHRIYTVVSFELAWPAPELSPNHTGHWRMKAAAKKAARGEAYIICREAIAGAWIAEQREEAVSVSLTFCPPDRRPRDMDNCLASCKAYIDGISDALGINDQRFTYQLRWGGIVKGGKVEVELIL